MTRRQRVGCRLQPGVWRLRLQRPAEQATLVFVAARLLHQRGLRLGRDDFNAFDDGAHAQAAAHQHKMTRPALANERVQIDSAGQLVRRLKTPWRDGTIHFVILEFHRAPGGDAAAVPTGLSDDRFKALNLADETTAPVGSTIPSQGQPIARLTPGARLRQATACAGG